MFKYCEERDQRIHEAVCENNIKKGLCKKDLLNCKEVKAPRKPEPLDLDTARDHITRYDDPAPTIRTNGDLEHFINCQLEPQRKADPLHPSNRRPGQFDLFGERKAE